MPHHGSVEPSRRELIERSLALWDPFPVDTQRRPIVLSGVAVLHNGGGFDSVEAKEAFSAGMVAADVDLEPGLLERLTEHAGAPNMDGLSALRVVKASSTHRRFMTDRGMRRLPAWDLELTHAQGVFTALSTTVETWWPPAWDSTMFHETQHPVSYVDRTSRQLSYSSFTGSPRDSIFQAGEVFESDCALHVTVNREWKEPRPTVMTLVGTDSNVEVTLDRPLGARVLIDHLGNPLPVVTR